MKNSPHSRRRAPSSLIRDLSGCESGNALIELAASLPLYLVLILGTAEIANLAWASVQVNNAARAAAAYASQSRANSTPGNVYIGLAAQSEAPKFITTPSTQVTSTQVCYCISGGSPGAADPGCANTNLGSCPSPEIIQVAAQINVQAPVTPIVHYPGLPATYNVSSQATMWVGQ